MKKERRFFDEEFKLDKISKLGDQLEKLNKVIDWEQFRRILDAAFEKENKGIGGRPSFDRVLMFKILVLQRLYNLSDEQTEFQINDRLSFQRFLGLTLSDTVPDSTTIWLSRDTLSQKKTAEKLFARLNRTLEEAGLIKNDGVMVDATFVDAPRQHNSREENKTIKEGGIPEDWKNEDDEKNFHKVSQKDTDARWTKKRDETHYGYKNNVKADVGFKLIKDYTVTPASVHDSVELPKLVKSGDKIVYADACYVGKEEELPGDVEAVICEKGYRNHPLTDLRKVANRIKSSIRCRIEHIFDSMTNSMHGLFLRCIGKTRADFNIGLTNLVYNMCRMETLKRCSSKRYPELGPARLFTADMHLWEHEKNAQKSKKLIQGGNNRF